MDSGGFIHCDDNTSVNTDRVTHIAWERGADGHTVATVHTPGGKFAITGDAGDKLADKLGWSAHVKAVEAARVKAEKEAEAEAEKEARAAEQAAKAEAKAAEEHAAHGRGGKR